MRIFIDDVKTIPFDRSGSKLKGKYGPCIAEKKLFVLRVSKCTIHFLSCKSSKLPNQVESEVIALFRSKKLKIPSNSVRVLVQ